jgi:hypothetical protein
MGKFTMDFATDLKIAHHNLIHGGRLNVYQLADAVGRSHSYLCRISSPTEDVPFPSDLEDMIMDLQKNYEPLHLKNARHGFASYKIPNAKMSKGDENELVSNYHKAAASAFNDLSDFVKQPDQKQLKKLLESLNTIIAESVGVSKWAAKKASKQMEMF